MNLSTVVFNWSEQLETGRFHTSLGVAKKEDQGPLKPGFMLTFGTELPCLPAMIFAWPL